MALLKLVLWLLTVSCATADISSQGARNPTARQIPETLDNIFAALATAAAAARLDTTPGDLQAAQDAALERDNTLAELPEALPTGQDAVLEESTSTEASVEALAKRLEASNGAGEARSDALAKYLKAVGTAQDGIETCYQQLASIDNEKDVALLHAGQLSIRLESAEQRSGKLSAQLEDAEIAQDTAEQRVGELSAQLEVTQVAQAAAEEQVANLTAQLLEVRAELAKSPAQLQDCSGLTQGSPSGVYLLDLGLDAPVPAFCDMQTDGGGWTVIQRRADIQPREVFNRTWLEYKNGFGNLTQEQWWGNEHIHLLTSRPGQSFQLRIELGDWEGNTRYAEYQGFRVTAESDNYRLLIAYNSYSGDAGEDLQYHANSAFSTHDKDNDGWSGNCAKLHSGGWWWGRCGSSRLNSEHEADQYPSSLAAQDGGVAWSAWKGLDYSLKDASMKIRPV